MVIGCSGFRACQPDFLDALEAVFFFFFSVFGLYIYSWLVGHFFLNGFRMVHGS